ncbi:MAG: T9SS type A sorting domain-containing protein [Bacteroidia bacterium]|nr:T9SS type A sorting domain-containing protein [Bacteroidia bacterium]
MKHKLLTLAVFILSCCAVNAQITLTSGNIVGIGDVVCLSYDTLPQTSIVPGNAGAGQNWNLSALVSHRKDTMRFMHPASTPYDTAFTGDNASALFVGKGIWAYFYKDAAILQTLGMVGDLLGNGNIMAIELNPRETIMEFPFTYQDSFTDTTGMMVIMDTVKMVQTTVNNVVADAWGIVTTPTGAFNSLRMFSTKIQLQEYFILVNTVWVPAGSQTDTSYHYEWWSNNTNLRFPVASFTWDPVNLKVDDEVEFLNGTYSLVPVKETASLSTVFPNPSKGIFMIEAENISSLEVCNIYGQTVLNASFDYSVSSFKIDMRNQSKGVYILRMKTQTGMETRKLVFD